jgi:hypothetical protein
MKIKLLTAILAAVLCLTACSETATNDASSEKPTDTTTTTAAPEETTAITGIEGIIIETTTSSVTKVTTNPAVTTTPISMPVLAEELSDKYADLDNRSFKYKGKIMTLGVSTVEDFLDADAVLKDYKPSTGYRIDPYEDFNEEFRGEFRDSDDSYFCYLDPGSNDWSVIVAFVNPDGSPKKLKDCVIAAIIFYVDEEIKPESSNNFAENLEFAFDDTLTHGVLLANSGKPTHGKPHGRDIDYKKAFGKYEILPEAKFYIDTVTDLFGYSYIIPIIRQIVNHKMVFLRHLVK